MRALLEVYSTLVRLSPPTLDVLLPPLLVHNATTVVPGNKQVCAEPPERMKANRPMGSLIPWVRLGRCNHAGVCVAGAVHRRPGDGSAAGPLPRPRERLCQRTDGAFAGPSPRALLPSC